MKHPHRKCPICNHDTVDPLHFQRFALPVGHPLSEGYDVVCCRNCGFVYANTAVPQEVYDRFYAQYSKYEDKQTGTGGIEQQWDRERVEETARQIAEYLNDTTLSVLDVGCANGGLLKALRHQGFENLLGIDPSPICVENARQLGVAAEVGSLFQPFSYQQFDCVVLSHTLEHVQNLPQAASWISSVMKSNAILYVEVPDASRYKDFIDSPFQDFNTEHINHFSLTSLKNYLNANGFEPLRYGEKTIPASANKPYPAIFCFARKGVGTVSLETDALLRTNIEEYIKNSRLILDLIENRLSVALANTRRIIVWGTGQLAMKLLVETSLANAEIIAFVDSNPINQGKLLHGINVLSPTDIHKYTEPILISTTLHQQSIMEQIHELGLHNPIILLKDN